METKRPTRNRSRLVPVLCVAGLLVTLSGVTPAVASTATPSAWMAGAYDTGQSGWNSKEVTETPARVKVMKLNFALHTAPSPDPGNTCLYPIGPVTAAGRLFDVGPDGISAYNQWSGARLWNVPTPTLEQFSTMVMQVVGSTLYVSLVYCESVTNAGSVVDELNVATGKPVHPSWSPTGGDAGMAVLNGVMVANESGNSYSWVSGYTVAGHRLWSTPYGWSGYFNVFPAANGLVFVRDLNGDLAALQITSGSVAWDVAGNTETPVALSQDGADLYTTDGSNLFDINPLTGAAKGWVEAAGRGSFAMAIDATTVYSACAGSDLCATSRSTGKSLWTVNAAGIGQPVVAAGVVYYAGRSYLTTTGARIRSAADGTSITAVAGGRVYGLKRAGGVGPVTAIVSYK